MQFPDIVLQLKKYSSLTAPIYLVGGAVRDTLLELPSKDFDFVCKLDPRIIAREFADANSGVFYVMDEERHTCRVIIAPKTRNAMVFDFARMRGETIEQDLAERDFSINAMAVDLSDLEHVIDPMQGGRDLLQKWLRSVKPTAMEDDPVRVIRAIRYAVNLGLKIEPVTSGLIMSGAKMLGRVSLERKRDEFFKILEGKNPATALQLLKRLSILHEANLDTRPDFDLACHQVQVLDEMIDLLCGKKDLSKHSSFFQTSLLLRLSRFKEQLERHYFHLESTGRNRKGLVILSLILSNYQDQNPLHQSRNMILSTDENVALDKMKSRTKFIDWLNITSVQLDNRSIYKFFKENDDTGIDLVMISLAEYASNISSEISQNHWLKLLEKSEALIKAWYFEPDIVTPTPLLNGNELMFNFDLVPGPLIREIIEGLKEEQAAGNIATKADAMEWVELHLQRNSL